MIATKLKPQLTSESKPSAGSLSQLLLPDMIWYASVKDVLDFTLAALIFVVAGPVMLLAAFVVKLTSRGPAFYSQTRVGRYGKVYTIYKLRSMRHDCEKKSGPQWSTRGDPRITPFGKFLRKSHIDELPQLWNVFRGEMSLIGPRPERPEFVPQLDAAIPAYRARLLVKPGVTGLAQILLAPDTDLQSVRLKLAHDLHYVKHHSFVLDMHILFGTVFHVLAVPYHMMPKIVSLPGGAPVCQAYEEMVAEYTVKATPKSKPSIRIQEELHVSPIVSISEAPKSKPSIKTEEELHASPAVSMA